MVHKLPEIFHTKGLYREMFSDTINAERKIQKIDYVLHSAGLSSSKDQTSEFCERAEMKLRWKQVRILHGPATVRKECCQRSHWVERIREGRQCIDVQVRKHA